VRIDGSNGSNLFLRLEVLAIVCLYIMERVIEGMGSDPGRNFDLAVM
jgi:hypothetical protein